MAIFWQEQEFAREKTVAVLHGGAAPIDPQGKAREDAIEELRKIAAIIDIEAFTPTIPLKTALGRNEALVLHALALMEDHPRFNAGFGAALQEDGQVRLSASFMESQRESFSAIMNVQRFRYASQLAFALQREQFTMLDNQGSQNLKQQLTPREENLITGERWRQWVENRAKNTIGQAADRGPGTVGAVVRTAVGLLAAGTSTGGVGSEVAGRVGDTPTVAGNFCTQKVAISATGIGETICNLGCCVRIASLVDIGIELRTAVRQVVEMAEAKGYNIGVIAVGLNENRRTSAIAAVSCGEMSFVFREIDDN